MSSANDHPSHVVKKRTIIKDRIGCVRTSTYNLPAEGHAYGHMHEVQPEPAGDIISNWVTANPSLEKTSTRMLVYSNVLAIKKGHITAKTMRQYAIEHPNIRLKEALPTNSTRVSTSHEGPFGVKTKYAEESMSDLLQAKYTDFTNEDTDYPSVTSIKRTGFMPISRPTIASQAIINARLKAEEKAQPKHFIMKKFQNIKGTMQRERERQAGSSGEYYDNE